MKHDKLCFVLIVPVFLSANRNLDCNYFYVAYIDTSFICRVSSVSAVT